MTGESDLPLQLHELLTFLGARGVATFLVNTQHGVVGDVRTQVDVSYLADNVLLMRYFESKGSVRRALSVLKKRSGSHETTIRELTLSSAGISIGAPLVQFRGIMSGSPQNDQAGFEQDLRTEARRAEDTK